MGTPKRLENIHQLQWELDAWLAHYARWQAEEDGDIGVQFGMKVQALDKAAQALFDVFGQPDPEERLSEDKTKR